MLTVNNISVQFGGVPLFSDISFMITPVDRIGLAGRNGAGKSTLMKIICGEVRPETGNVAKSKATTVGYLTQHLENVSDRKVVDEAKTAFKDVLQLEKHVEQMREELINREDYESDSYTQLIEDLQQKEHQLQLNAGYSLDEQAERVLKGLGFEQEDFEKRCTELSGGWKMRVELAKILLQQPDVILLDEPTNHLDIESITWLEDFLISYPGATMLVSHDKAFLDNVTNRTIEISLGKAEDYKATYSKYLEMRALRKEKQIAAQKNQQDYIKQLERNIEKFRAKKNKAKFAQTLIRKVEKMERIEVDQEDTSKIKIRFPEAPPSGKLVVEAKNACKSYGENHVIRSESFHIAKGDRIAFVGKNGMGKTTLSRMIAGDLDFTGHLELGHNVELGFYAQHQADSLEGDQNVFEVIDNAATGDLRTKVRGILGAFLFSGDDIYKKVKVLSGGEKSRLALCKMLLQEYNLIILDEPTNHLDMVAKEVLKKALLNFGGTIIVVSHDRDFLQGLTNRVFEFSKDGLKEHQGDVYDFLATKKVETFRELELKVGASVTKKQSIEKQGPSSNKVWFETKKQLERDVKKLKREVSKSESRIDQLEAEIQEIEGKLKDPEGFKEVANDQGFFENYEKLKKDLEKEMETWESSSGELEKVRQELQTLQQPNS